MIITYLVTLQRVNKDNKMRCSQLPTFKYQAQADTSFSEVANHIISTFNNKDTHGYEYIIEDIKILDELECMNEVLDSIN